MKIWNADKIVSLSAILISLMTLMVLILQTNMIRQQQRLSVYPHLMMNNQGTGSANYKLVLSNSGIGPALVESVEVIYKDSVYKMDLPNFLYREVHYADSLKNVWHSNIWAGMLIPAEKVIPIFEVDNSISDARALLQLLDTLDIEMKLIYRSIYEERWELSSETGYPVLLD